MSATLTWHSSGLGAKTGTGNADIINDMEALVLANASDPNFKWEVADSENSANPMFLNLKRKDASDGRLLFVIWTSAPAGNNPAILDQAPQTNTMFVAFFPDGNVDTPDNTNLSASSGTIMGDDTNCTKVASVYFISSLYATGNQPFYFDCEDGMIWAFQIPSSSTMYLTGGGNLVVDAADDAYPMVIGGASANWAGFSGVNPPLPYNSAAISAGSFSAQCIQANYPLGTKGPFFRAFHLSTAWGENTSSTDLLLDSGASKAYFEPTPLIGQVRGQGIKLRLRQIGHGPNFADDFATLSGTGPVVKAMQVNSYPSGVPGAMWLTNFKI